MHNCASAGTLPEAFCWTRMGVESGQSLHAIVQRKELERRSNDGLFLWGIGNPLGAGLRRLAEVSSSPSVLFSPIRVAAAKIDQAPDEILAWLDYIDEFGQLADLPRASFVVSRGGTASNGRKRVHYALFCKSEQALALGSLGKLNFGELKNIHSNRAVGFSQVTAVVARASDSCGLRNIEYDVTLRAELMRPYIARLSTPAVVRRIDFQRVQEAAGSNDVFAWDEAVGNLKAQLRYETQKSMFARAPMAMT